MNTTTTNQNGNYMKTTLYVPTKTSVWSMITAIGVLFFASLLVAKGEEVTGCLSLSLEYRFSSAWVWKNGVWENEQSAPPLWKVYKQDNYTRVYSYDSTYFDGYYNETVSWDEDASYRSTYYPDGSADHDVQTGGTASGTRHRWVDGGLNVQSNLYRGDEILVPPINDEIFWWHYNPDHGYWFWFFLAPPGFTPDYRYDAGTANTWHHEQIGATNMNNGLFEVTWDYTRDDTYSVLYTTPELLEYAKTVLANEYYYPGGTNWETSWPLEAWMAYKDLDSSETSVDWGAGLYRMGFTGKAGVSYDLNWIERFIPDGGGPAIDTVISETVIATGEPQHTTVHYVAPPTENGHVIIVLPKVGCSECAAGTDTIQSGSVGFSVSLGNSMSGDSAGSLHLYGATPDNTLATPDGLRWELFRDAWGWSNPYLGDLVVAPEVIAAIPVLNDYAYEIQLYHPADFPDLDGVPVNAPFAVWQIVNPDSSGTSSNQLNIIKTSEGMTVTNQYVWSDANQGWSLTSGNGLRKESKTKTIDSGTGDEIVTVEIRNGSDQLVSKEQNRFHTFAEPLGRALVEHIVDPQGAALTSTFQYFDNPTTDGTNYGKLKLTVGSSGSWTRYEYDSTGRMTKEISGFLNAAPNAAESACRVRELDYTPVDALDTGTLSASTPRRVIEKLLGQEISRRYTVILSNETREIQCVVPIAAANSPSNLVTITKTFGTGNDWVVGKPRYTLFPDGTCEVHAYEFVPNNSSYTNVIHTVLRGVPNSTDETDILDGTRTTLVMTDTGRAISTTVENYVRPTSAAPTLATLSAQNNVLFDVFNRALRTEFLDGTHQAVTYNCCGMDSVTNRDGTFATFEYDALHRRTAEHRYVSPTHAISSASTFDPLGNALTTTRTGTNGTTLTTSTSVYDLAGRLVSSSDALNQTTKFTNYLDSAGQNIRITTLPDLTTRIETNSRNGELLGVGGTAAHGMTYGYGVEQVDGVWCSFTTQSNGPTEWVKSYTDAAGRGFKTVYAAASGSPAETKAFNSKGQLASASDADGVTRLFSYNARGEQEITAVDLHGDRQLHLDGSNRVSSVYGGFDLHGGFDIGDDYGAVRWTQSSVLPTIGSGEPWDWLGLNYDVASVDGLQSWRWMNNGADWLLTHTQTILDPSQTLRVTTVTAPDNSYTVTTNQWGRLLSVTRRDSINNQLSSINYSYDEFGRQSSATDARNGTTTFSYDVLDRPLTVTTPDPDGAPASGPAAQTTTSYYDTMGRVWKTTLPDSTSVTNEFFATGEIKKSSGSRTYPVEYTYDHAGRMKTMKTWQNYANNSGAAVTTWNYDAYRGWLSSKVYAGNQPGPSYTYTAAGRIQTRTWARGITTSYGYNGAGELASVDYSDATPDVSFGYNRRGRQTTVTANGVTTAMAYNIPGQLLAESYTGGPLDGLSVTNGYDDLLRRTNVSVLSSPSSVLSSIAYGYDAASRLSTVSEGTNSATYSYLANSPLVENIAFKNNGALRMTTTKTYDKLNRLMQISSVPSVSSVVSFSYEYNSANQRTAVTNADASRWNFGYDALGQVTSGKKRWSDGTLVAGEQFEYTFDDIGNRKQSRYGGDANGSLLRRFNYSANLLNQYTSRSAGPGTTRFANILGEATNAATVTVNDQAVARHGDYFRVELPVTNTAPVWLGITNLAVLNQGTNDDLIATNLGSVFVPPTPETFGNDADGNLTNDGRFALKWDAENRLVMVESLSSAPVGSKRRVEWTFDGLGRRIRQTESIWNPSTLNYQPSTDTKLVNDGWRCIAELNTSNSALRTYAWGLDLSGSLGGAGGVGGLLMVNASINSQRSTHFYAYDGNGNVSALVSAATGTASANYEYEPFGVTLRTTGPMASENPFRFSTKRTSDATDWVLYEYRIYNPGTGRWLGRDPLGEFGGRNLHNTLGNHVVGAYDVLGLYEEGGHFYTTFNFAIRNSYSYDDAFAIAYYSQLPDETEYNATSAGVRMLGMGPLANAGAAEQGFGSPDQPYSESDRRFDMSLQTSLHSLHGGLADAVAKRRCCLEKLIHDGRGSLKNWEMGLLIHALGDSYAHTKSDGSAFGPPFGHAADAKRYPKSSDVPANHPQTYIDYTTALNRAMGGGMSATEMSMTQKVMTLRHGGFHEDITAARGHSMRIFGYNSDYDPDFGDKLSNLGTLTTAQVQSLMEKIKNACASK